MTTPPPVDPRFGAPIASRPARRTGLLIGIGVGAGLLVVVAAVVAVSVLASALADRRAARAEAIAKMNAESARLKNEMDVDADLSDPEQARKFDGAVDRMSDAAGSLDARMKPMVRTVMEEFGTIGKEASAASKRLEDAGGIDPSTMPTLASANARLALLQSCKAAGEGALRRVKGVVALARATGTQNGLSEKEINAFVAGMNKTGNIDKLTRVREIDVELYGLFIQSVTALRDNFGNWEVQDGELIFTAAPEGTQATYDGFAERMEALAAEQNAVIQQLQGR